MNTVSKQSTKCNPVILLKRPLRVNSPYSHMANVWAAAEGGNAIACFHHMQQMYKSIEDRIARDDDPVAWKMVRSFLDDIQQRVAEMVAEEMPALSEDMWAVGLIGGGK